ncbi:MAG: hypothetical protein ABIC95_01745 [archaeon]
MGEDIQISYEILFEFLRREKSREEIQEMSPDFFGKVSVYLTGKRALITDDKGPGECDKLNNQVANAEKLAKELYTRREKKIVHLALYQVRVGSKALDTKNLLPDEKVMLDEIITVLRTHRDAVLSRALGPSDALSLSPEPSQTPDQPGRVSSTSAIAPQDPDAVGPEPLQEDSSIDGAAETDGDTLTLRMLIDVPKFIGPDLEVIGPLKKGETIHIDQQIADLLMRNQQAERV